MIHEGRGRMEILPLIQIVDVLLLVAVVLFPVRTLGC